MSDFPAIAEAVIVRIIIIGYEAKLIFLEISEDIIIQIFGRIRRIKWI